MATKLEDLILRITADSSSLRRELGRIETQNASSAKKLSTAWDRAGLSIDGISSKLKGIGIAVGALAIAKGAELISSAFHAIGGEVDRLQDIADSVDKVSGKLGIGTKALQVWRFAARDAGVEQAQFDKALQTFITRAGEAERGVAETRDAFRELGVSIRDQNGELKSSEALFAEALRALGKIENAQTRVYLASKLLGQRGTGVLNLAADFDNATAHAEKLGIALEDDVISSFVRSQDASEALSAQLDQRLSGSMSKLAIVGVAIKEKFVEFISEIDTAIDRSETLSRAFENITPPRLLDDIDVVNRRIAETEIQLNSLNDQILNFVRTSGAGLPQQALASQVSGLTDRLADASKELVELRKKRDELLAPPKAKPASIAEGPLPREEDEAAKNRARELARALRELNSVIDSSRTPGERLAATMEKLTRDFQAGLLSVDQFREGQAAVEKQFLSLAVKAEKAAREIADPMTKGLREIETVGHAVFEGLTGALADFVLGAEVNLENLLRGFARSFVQIGIQQAALSAFPSLGNVIARAGGGPISAGQPYLVGEKGPELIVPSASGFVVPSGGIASSSRGVSPASAVTVNVINQTPAQATVAERRGSSGQREIEVLITQIAASDVARGGAIGRAMDSRYGKRPRGA